MGESLDSFLETTSASKLVDPLDVNELCRRSWTQFSVQNFTEDEIQRTEELNITEVYGYDKLQPYLLESNEMGNDCDNDNDSSDNLSIDDPSKAFPLYRKSMFNLTEDGKILKKIEEPGIGEIPCYEGKIIAYVHYSFYVEYGEYPFDITRLRQKDPLKIKLGRSEVIPGLEMAIKSMKKKEKSKFLVHPDLAYRKPGIPPRIPPNATILMDIELVDVCVDEAAYDAETNEEGLPKKFEDVMLKAKNLRKRGNQCKLNERNTTAALHNYHKALYLLHQSHYANDEEENQAREYMVELYSNIAICYMEKKSYKKVCIQYNEAMRDCKELADKNVKLLYNSAKALKFLGNFNEAENRLKKAFRLAPTSEVLKEIDRLDAAKENYLKEEKLAAKRMFGFNKPDDFQNINDENTNNNIAKIDDEFKKVFLERLEAFIKSDRKSLVLNWHCSADEKNFCVKETKKAGLIFKEKEVEGSLVFTIKKTEI